MRDRATIVRSVLVDLLASVLVACHGEPPPREGVPGRSSVVSGTPSALARSSGAGHGAPLLSASPAGGGAPTHGPVPSAAPGRPPAGQPPRAGGLPPSEPPVEPVAVVPDPAVNPTLAALQAALDGLLAAPELAPVEIGVFAADVETGTALLAHEPDVSLNPASNEKLATTATALARLGPEHAFTAQILRADRTLYVRGGGDPTLTTKALRAMLAEAAPKLAGVTLDEVVVDEGAFSGSALPPRFEAKRTDAAYRAATGLTVLDEGAVTVELAPGAVGQPVLVTVTPAGDYLVLDNRGKTVAGKVSKIGVETGLQSSPNGPRTTLTVRGRLGVSAKTKPITVRRVEAPSWLAASAAHAILRELGVKITGGASVGSVPAGAVVLAERVSAPLSTIVQRVNKDSNNFCAEMLLRAIAVHACTPAQGAVAPCPSGANWDNGTSAVRAFLEGVVTLDPASFAYHNGSGLYDGGRFSPRGLVSIITAMHGHAAAAAFEGSLAVAGTDGTLAGRLSAYAGRVRAKTGTLDDVSSLAGLIATKSGRLAAFAVIMNRSGGKTAAMRRLQDKIVGLIAEQY
jgi:D-alanyl-D-alanine carboxypeptidase/D-alanyl-D-alanine-endopeptidase (penicillin-binding protein 4)